MMRNTVLNYIDRFRHDRRERLVFGFVLLFLAVIVSLSVYWQLRYTGITMTNVTYCGYEEHIHTDECYEKTLICGLEETEGHTHSEECYDEEGNLICGLEECEGHTHTDECYEYTLICGLEEHTHTTDCLIDLTADVEDSTVWEATLPVTTGDIRTNIVNIATSQLGYTESAANYSVAEDGVTHMGYTRYGAWYGNEYGSWDAMFAAFCLHYAGIDESEFPVNSGALAWSVQLKELGRYADAADYTPSTGDIVFFDSDSDGRIDRVGVVTAVDESAGMVTIIEGDYTSGEVDTVCQHIYPLSNTTIVGFGIIPVVDETDTTIYNTDTTTEETTDETTDESTDSSEEVTEDDEEVIIDEEDTEGASEEETSEEETESVFTASDSGVTVTVTAPAGALPEDAVLSVTLIDEESEEYAAAAEAVGYDTTEAESAVNAISEDEDDTEETEDEISTALAVLDISFTVDGVTVEPSEAVTVSIDASSLMTDDADASTLEVQHLEETAEGITPVLVADATDDTEGTVDAETAVAEFTVESFSSFTLRWSYTQNRQTNYQNVTVYVKYTDGTTYSTDGNDIDLSECTYTFSSDVTMSNSDAYATITAGTAVTLKTLLEIDGYTFNQANVTYTTTSFAPGQGQTTTTTTLEDVETITYTRNQNNGYFTVDSSQLQNAQNVTIYLYYTQDVSATLTVNKTYVDSDGVTEISSSDTAGFTVYASDGTTVVDTDSITGAGTCEFALSNGTYILTETSVPDGYDTPDSVTFVVADGVITVDGTEVSTITVTNKAKTTVTVAKVYTEADGITTIDSSDTAGFTVYASDGTTVVDTDSITGAGTCEFALSNGTYILTETSVPDGYDTPDSVTFVVADGVITVDGTEVSTITVTNKAKTTVTVTKVYTEADGITAKDSSDTAGFTVYESDGTTVVDSDTITGADTCEFVLSNGTYILTETDVPDGYVTPDSVTFVVADGVITVDGAEVSTVTVTNKAYTEVKVSKAYKAADGSNKKTADVKDLEAVFTITASDGTTYSDSIDGKGTLTFSLPDGEYTITESTVPDGYFASDDVTFKVDSGVVYVDGVATAQNTITFTNTEKTTLTITKVYVNSSGSKVSTGIDSLEATFTITDGTNTYSGTITGAGEYVFEGDEALADGTYTLSETAAGGYVAVDDVTVTISGGEISISTVDNVSLSDDTITVTNDPDENHSLAGMSYAIANLDNTNQNKYAMMASVNSSGGLDGLEVEEVSTTDGIALIKGDATVWTFEAADGDNNYYIYTTINGTKYYLNVTANNQSGVTISTSEQILTVETDDSTGKVRITNTDDTVAVNWYGGSNASNLIFGGYYGNDKNEWLTLCQIYEEDGLTIIDNLVTDGEYEAHLVIDNVAVDLTDSRYTVTWYRSDYTLSTDLSTCENNQDYKEVTNSDALGENDTTVNVAIDGGGLCYYYVTVEDTVTGKTYSTLTYQVEHVPYAAELMNCSFEYKQSSTNVPFWNTTAYDGQIEIGAYSSSASNYGTQYIYAGGSQAVAGDYFAELNANYEGSLYQDVLTIGGESLNWAFYHRARTADGGSWTGTNITDEMYVVIMSAEDAEKLLSGIDQTDQQSVVTTMIESILGSDSEGSGTYVLEDGDYEGDTVSATIWTVSSTNSYQTGEWNLNSGSYTVPEGQYVTRFFFVSKTSGYKDAGKSNGYTVGNLIDYATFSQDITYVIEYWTINNNGTYDLASTYTQTGSAYPYTVVSAQYLSEFSSYGLVGSITGTKSGGSSPTSSAFDEYTTTSMRVTSSTMYLSLYLDTPVVAVVKVLEGLDDVLTSIDAQTVTFNIVQVDTNALAIDPLYVTVGNTGTGSNYTGVLSAGTYTISESDYNETITVGDVDYAWTGVTVTISDDSANLTDNGDGTYSFELDVETSLTITFTNTYAEVTTGGPEMPQTGGGGTKLYAMVGILLICSASYLLYILKQQRQLKQQKRKCKWRWNI